MQAAFQWRFPGLFLHIFLYTFFYFHAASDPAHLLSQHFGCYCCPAFSLASPFVFPFFSYLTLHLPAHFLYQHFGCYYCLIIFPRFPFRSFFSHISNVFNLLIFNHNTPVAITAWLSFHVFHFTLFPSLIFMTFSSCSFFYLNFRVGYYVHYRFPLSIFFSQFFDLAHLLSRPQI